MAEGFDPSDAPVRRGRRDPELALQLEAGIGDAQEDEEEYALSVGDEMVYKITEEQVNPISNKDRWVTYGAKTTVRRGEDEPTAFTRLVTIVHGRMIEATEYADQLAEEAEAERRKIPIVPQQQRDR
jgi:hypothetical protein